MGKLDSLPAKDSTGNFVWVVAPLDLIASFRLPQFVFNSAIYSMQQDDIVAGFQVFAPLLVVYVLWPAVGLPALIAVAPFLIGCAAQFAFEAFLGHRKSSCWPAVPIIFEVCRLYQLSKAANFIEKLMMEMKGMPVTPALVGKSGALFPLIVVFQALGLLCLWYLLTFLLRLFPSRAAQ